jgi:WD40-like Beta Propeller Repeat
MVAHRMMLRGLAAFCALVAGSVLVHTSAQAAVTHKLQSQITDVPAGAGVAVAGPLTGVNAMAIDSNNLYVAEYMEGVGGERLDEFNASSGAFVRQFPASPSLLAFYYFGIAAGHSAGEEQVYVGAEDGEYKDFVAVFDGEGHPIGAPWSGSDTPSGSFSVFGIGGIATDSSTSLGDWAAGDVYVSDRNNKVVDVFKPLPGGKEEYVTRIEGPEVGIPFGEPSRVAVDQANGDVVVVDQGDVLDVFEPTVLDKYALIRKITGTPAGPFSSLTSVAIDSGNGDIYVDSESENTVDQFSASGEYLGHLTGTAEGPFYRTAGLAVDSETHELYVGSVANVGGHEPGAVDVFGPDVVIPDVTTGPSLSVEPTSATVSGTVNPRNAGQATCQIVWGTTTEFGNTTPCSAPVANGEGGVPVQATLGGLSPDTTYHYRLQASNENGLNEGESYQNKEFHTSGPGLHGQWSTSVSSESVTLNGQIDPVGSPTTYYFQYGTSTSYGTDLPAPPGASAGSGSGDVTVSRHVQGLAAATTYHYRLVVMSELPGGELVEFASPDQSFTTQFAAASSGATLPDGRAWEMVSPPNKQGAKLETPFREEGTSIEASVNGDALTYTASGPTEEQPLGNRNPELSQLLSTRGPGGWTTKDITTPYSEVGYYRLNFGMEYRFFSSDLSIGALLPYAETKLSSEATELTSYLRHNNTCEASPSTCYVPLVTAANVEPPGLKFVPQKQLMVPLVGTPDLSHVIIKSTEIKLLPGGSEEESGLYEWSAGKLQLVTILPDGHPAPSGGSLGNKEKILRHSISDDGARVVFTAAEDLYVRNMVSGKTVQVDSTEPGAQGGPQGAQSVPLFQTANSDVTRVFFTDTARLTVDSTALERQPDLYEFNVETEKVTDLTADHNHPENSYLEHADVQGLVQGASEDGSYVYFVANGVLAPGAVPGHCGGNAARGATCNLYLRHAGVTTFIAALSIGDQQWSEESGKREQDYVTARVSPDGRWFTFMSDRSLTGYDNRDANSGEPDEEVFLYDAASKRLTCASCNPTGARPVGMFVSTSGHEIGPLVDRLSIWGNHWLAATIPSWGDVSLFIGSFPYQTRYLNNDGRLFFNSNEGLVPQDVNGTMDVYEYEPEHVGDCTNASSTFGSAAGGCVGLISSGGSAEESVFIDASESGNDVFFLTAARLRPEDFDTELDMYDAQVCDAGSPCLPVPPASPPPCTTGDSCKPAPTPQPTIFGATPSATFSGIGNLAASSAPAAASTRSLTRAQKLARALRVCRHKHGRRERQACLRQARKRYGGKPAGKRSGTHGVRSASVKRGSAK